MMMNRIMKIQIFLIIAASQDKNNKIIYDNRANKSILRTELELKNFYRCKASNSLSKFSKCPTQNSSNLPSRIDFEKDGSYHFRLWGCFIFFKSMSQCLIKFKRYFGGQAIKLIEISIDLTYF